MRNDRYCLSFLFLGKLAAVRMLAESSPASVTPSSPLGDVNRQASPSLLRSRALLCPFFFLRARNTPPGGRRCPVPKPFLLFFSHPSTPTYWFSPSLVRPRDPDSDDSTLYDSVLFDLWNALVPSLLDRRGAKALLSTYSRDPDFLSLRRSSARGRFPLLPSQLSLFPVTLDYK